MRHREDQRLLNIVARHVVERCGKAIKPLIFNPILDVQENLLANFSIKSPSNGNKEPFYSKIC